MAFASSSGYLVGARRGAVVRRGLRERIERTQRDVDTLTAQVGTLRQASVESAAIRSDLERALEGLERGDGPAIMQSIRAEIRELATSIVERDSNELALRAKDANGLRDIVQKALSPILERDRLGRELAQLEGGTSLGELPRILDAIAQKGGFSSVVLSDDVGLPLAASASAKSVDWLAGIASVVLTLVDRAERVGEPKPIGVVVRDESNQLVIHRMFRVGGAQFLLTAVRRGGNVAPDALDPALAKLERALSRPEVRA